MRSKQDIRQVAKELEESARTISSEELSLDETLRQVSQIVRTYRTFEAFFENAGLDVRKIVCTAEGSFTEEAFDWQALYDKNGVR